MLMSGVSRSSTLFARRVQDRQKAHLPVIANDAIKVEAQGGEYRFRNRSDLFVDVVFAIERVLEVVDGLGPRRRHQVMNQAA